MPIYEYQCPFCDDEAVTEVLAQPSDEAPLCASCGARLARLVSRSDFVLVGDGWARDGYAKKQEVK
jgi:putative FmdB family regulatory protein